MYSFHRRLPFLGITAVASGAFVGGALLAGPLSRIPVELIDVRLGVAVIFILICLLIALRDFGGKS